MCVCVAPPADALHLALLALLLEVARFKLFASWMPSSFLAHRSNAIRENNTFNNSSPETGGGR